MNTTKKLIAILLAALILTAFAGCSVTFEKTTSIDLKAKLASLLVNDKDTDLSKATDLADLNIVGTWKTADESVTYTFEEFNETGKATATVSGQTTTVTYKCLDIDGKFILQEEVPMMSYTDDSEEPVETTAIVNTAYEIENDVLYMVSVEEMGDETTSFQAALQIMYRADENGSIEDAVSRNPISIESLYGSWEEDGKAFTLDADGLKVGDDVYAVSVEGDKFVAEKDGEKTEYSFRLTYSKVYTDNSKTEIEKEGYVFFLSFTGKDENDKPNLASVLSDWKTEYDYDEWLYSGNFAEVDAVE